MSKKLTDLTTKTTAAAADWMLINDVSASTDKKTSVGGLAAAVAANIPSGGLSSIVLSNPYKFSIYRNTAYTFANASSTLMPFDTKSFDTGTNTDITTNFGRFTAPVAGFYMFEASINFTSGVLTRGFASIYKNGTEVRRGGDPFISSGSGQVYHATVTGFLQLAANNFVEVYYYVSGSTATAGTGQITSFSGYLVSLT